MATVMLLLPIQVQAVQLDGKSFISGSQEFVNTNLSKGARLSSSETVQAPRFQSSSNEIVYSLSSLKNIVKSNMYDRTTSFSVDYKGDTSYLKSDINNIIEDILNQDDYLKHSSGYGFGYSGYENDVTIKFQFEYLTTKAQEDFVDSKVSSILGQIINSSMSSDQKEKSIHDYIVKNVQYDESLTRYSAYNALSEGKTVCQGYALLAYKMLKDAGIENRIVSGTGTSQGETESHAWNLVKLNGNWYQLDCTWDDPVPDVKNRVLYDYYNLTDNKMELDHTWDHSLYPSAATVYNEPSSDSSETEVLSGDGVNIDFSKYKVWGDSFGTVPKNKAWNVKFTKAFDPATVNSDNVVVYKEYNNLLYPVKDVSITYNDNKDTIYVTPLKEYTAGTYYLVITQNVLSKDEKAIPKPIVLTFGI